MKKLTLESAEVLANKFRSESGINLTEPIAIKSFLRKKNILTIYRPLSEGLYGLSLKSKANDRFMLINSNLTRGKQHFVIAHELFHLYYDDNLIPHLCRKDEGPGSTEKSADMFALALLMPKEGLLQFISADEISSKEVKLASIIKMEQYFSVSRSSMLLRLKILGRLSENYYQELARMPIKETAWQYGYDLSLYNSGNENLVIGDFGEKARLLYDNDKISEGHYLELLNLISNGKD